MKEMLTIIFRFAKWLLGWAIAIIGWVLILFAAYCFFFIAALF